MSFRVVEWLYPGMRVKRWVLLLVLGILIICSGLVLFCGVDNITVAERWLVQIVHQGTGRLPRYGQRLAGLAAVLAGIALVTIGVRQTVRTLLFELAPAEADNVANIMYVRRKLRRGPRVVVVGGGTGLATLLRGLKEYTSNITAIVTVADDGGSSGQLRAELGMLPPGDIRNTLVALADAEPLMQKLFQYRFPEDQAGESEPRLAGHSFGNLFIAAMLQVAGDFEQAVRESSRVLAIRGTVLPSTLQSVVLHAEYEDGSTVAGESQIPLAGKPIRRVRLAPADAAPLPDALRAIAGADLIVLGPGSLYTSVLPNLLVADIARAIRAATAVKVYACNVMTQPGETDGYSAADHLRAIICHAGPGLIQYCLANSAPITEPAAERYRQQGAYPVAADVAQIKALGITPVLRAIISENNLVRHDPAALAKAVLEVAGRSRPPVRPRAAKKGSIAICHQSER